MTATNFQHYAGKNILLLQGPLGPFFKNLATAFKEKNASVVKVNLNAGDQFFYPGAQYNFKGRLNEWKNFLEKIILIHKFDVILIFGQNRTYHLTARDLSQKYNIELGVFEEGYIRPYYVTLENYGVNKYSRLPKDPLFYAQQPQISKPILEKKIKNFFLCTMWFACLYYLTSCLFGIFYKHYQHHRKLSLTELFPWIRSLYRFYLYAYLERSILKKLIKSYDQKFFLVPLQVHNDAQIKDFEKLNDIEHFIRNTVHSFYKFAPKHHLLVFKHHPLDRGYTDYSALIDDLGQQYFLKDRLIYIHDLHLPTLFKHARGVIVINSTTGLQAIYHNTPVKVIGDAIYNFKGLAFQKPLHQFWKEAHKYKPNRDLYQKFKDYVIKHTQLNGSFYKKLKTKEAIGGLIWRNPNESND